MVAGMSNNLRQAQLLPLLDVIPFAVNFVVVIASMFVSIVVVVAITVVVLLVVVFSFCVGGFRCCSLH